jgi:hypothetical protein
MQLVGFLVLFYMLLRVLNHGREKREAWYNQGYIGSD